MLVKEIMTRQVELVEPNLSLKEAAGKMKNKKLVGICSLDDVAARSENLKLAGEVLKELSVKGSRPLLAV